MKSAPAVIDTNVVVSGVLTENPASPTVRILDGMLAGRFRFLLSVDLVAGIGTSCCGRGSGGGIDSRRRRSMFS
jgi:hypothetical protein